MLGCLGFVLQGSRDILLPRYGRGRDALAWGGPFADAEVLHLGVLIARTLRLARQMKVSTFNSSPPRAPSYMQAGGRTLTSSHPRLPAQAWFLSIPFTFKMLHGCRLVFHGQAAWWCKIFADIRYPLVEGKAHTRLGRGSATWDIGDSLVAVALGKGFFNGFGFSTVLPLLSYRIPDADIVPICSPVIGQELCLILLYAERDKVFAGRCAAHGCGEVLSKFAALDSHKADFRQLDSLADDAHTV